MKTPITYYGGKQQLVPHILPLIPEHDIYTEVYGGGLALFFAKKKVKNEIINDIDNFVMNFYAVLALQFDALRRKIIETPYARASFTVANTMLKAPQLFTPLQRAWAFYVLTNMGFSGRIGSFGGFTKGVKSMGFERKKEQFNSELFERMKGVQIECIDALEILKRRDTEKTFHYVDPPYFNSNMGHYSGFSEDQFTQLLGVLSELKGTFILSSYPSPILDQYVARNGWHQKLIELPISANGTETRKSRTKTEVLTANYPIDTH